MVHKIHLPPKIAQNILALLLSDKDKEALIGDFAEEHALLQKTLSKFKANIWYWKELLLSAPILISFKIRPSKYRRQFMKISPFVQPGKKSAIWSLLFLIPTMLLAIPGILQSVSGSDQLYAFARQNLTFANFSLWDWLVHPALVLFGLLLAFLISLFSIIGISLVNEEDHLVSTLTVKKSAWNLFPLVLALFFGTIIFIYLLIENFGPFFPM